MADIREHCCGADELFDRKTAQKQYRRYQRKGPARVTASLINQLGQVPVDGRHLMDIGGGIGALQWWFLDTGGERSTAVDASSGYLAQAEEHARSRGWEDRSRFHFGDFVDMAEELDQADLVTMDKVVCCYPNFHDILRHACRKSEDILAISYPMDGVISRGMAGLGALFSSLRGSAFRPYVHPVRAIRGLLAEEGFERQSHRLRFPWHTELYRRTLAAE